MVTYKTNILYDKTHAVFFGREDVSLPVFYTSYRVKIYISIVAFKITKLSFRVTLVSQNLS